MKKNIPIRKRRKRNRIPAVDLEITSLLDILVIILVFLLKNYNASEVVLNVSKEIALPKSESTTPNNAGVVIQISPGTIWVDDKVIVSDIRKDTIGQEKAKLFDQGGRRLIPLYNELIEKKKTYKLTNQFVKNTPTFSGTINLIVDQSIKYDFLKKIMFTCAEAGYKEYKFVVLGEEG